MFDEVFGLPAHPLLVHAAVVLTPLCALAAVVYAVLPRLHGRLAWAVVGLAVVTPPAVFAARQSGEAFKERLFAGGLPEGEFGRRILDHEGLAVPLLLSSLGLTVAVLLLVAVTARAGRGAGGGRGGGTAALTAATAALRVLVVAAALAALWYVVRIGHSGAEAVWSGR